tara:strand:+ start:289 stop:813 length:525 start_codon:yes stop_codon:yes gene_type:complete
MIKILSGKFKGRKLNKITTKTVRPTQAKVRKSIMDSIRDFKSKSILDLFAGSGTLGIEGMSRDAESVCFVDNDYKAIKVLKKNIELLELDEQCSIVKNDAIKFLKENQKSYDIIFADPPYGQYELKDIFPYIKKKLKNNGVFCFEQKKSKLTIESDFKIKNYGSTQVIFWEKKI